MMSFVSSVFWRNFSDFGSICNKMPFLAVSEPELTSDQESLGWRVGTSSWLRTINELINQVSPWCIACGTHFPEAPTVVQCDGIWVTIQGQEEEIKPDKRNATPRAERKESGDLGGHGLLARWETGDP